MPQHVGAFVGPLVGGQVLGRPSEAPQRQRALWLAAGTQEKEPVRIDAARRNFTTASTSNSNNKEGGAEDSIGRAKALAKPSESRAAQLREEKAKERAATKKKSAIPNPFEIPIKAGRAARRALESLGKVDEVRRTRTRATAMMMARLAGWQVRLMRLSCWSWMLQPPTNPDAYRLYFDQKVRDLEGWGSGLLIRVAWW